MLATYALRKTILYAGLFICFAGCTQQSDSLNKNRSNRYEDLVTLFAQWRTFQKPPLVDGIFDYSAPAMAKQHRELAVYQQRLAAIDTSGWTVAQRVDYHLIKAEMNGLDFE